jgi:hypothetical protein
MVNKTKAEDNFSRPQCSYFTILEIYYLKKVAHSSKALMYIIYGPEVKIAHAVPATQVYASSILFFPTAVLLTDQQLRWHPVVPHSQQVMRKPVK